MLILSSAVPNKTTAKSRPNLCPLHPVTKFTLTRIIIKDIVPTGWTHPHHILCQTFLKSDQYHCKNTISNYLQWAAVQYVRYICLNLHWLLFWEVHQDGFTNLTFWPNLLACFMYDQKSSRKIHFMALMCTLLGKASHLTAMCSWDTSLPVIYHIASMVLLIEDMSCKVGGFVQHLDPTTWNARLRPGNVAMLWFPPQHGKRLGYPWPKNVLVLLTGVGVHLYRHTSAGIHEELGAMVTQRVTKQAWRCTCLLV